MEVTGIPVGEEVSVDVGVGVKVKKNVGVIEAVEVLLAVIVEL